MSKTISDAKPWPQTLGSMIDRASQALIYITALSRKRSPLVKTVSPRLTVLILLFWSASAYAADKKSPAQPASSRFEISFSKEASAAPLDGHVLLVIANNNDTEPRF